LKLSEAHLSFLHSTNLKACSDNVISRFMLSLSLCLEVITLSGFHCTNPMILLSVIT
jgi:hypothetical protein